MKKLYFSFILALAALCASAQGTITFTINIDVDKAVAFYYTNPNDASKDTTLLKQGDNTITVAYAPSGDAVQFRSGEIVAIGEDVALEKVELTFGTGITVNPSYPADKTQYLAFSTSGDGAVITVTTKSRGLAASRTDSVNVVVVGDRSKVSITRYSNSANVELPADTFAVWFDPTITEYLQIKATTGLLYKVELNDSTVAYNTNYSRWEVRNMTKGDTVRITTDTDQKVPVTISLANGTDAACILSVLVNNQEITDWQSGFEVEFGASLRINFDTENYSIKIDGEKLWDPYLSVKNIIDDSYSVSVEATAWTTYNVKVTTETPDYVQFYNGKYIVLSAKETNFTVSEQNATISIMPQTDCSLDSVFVVIDGVSEKQEIWWNEVEFDVTSDLEIIIYASKIIRDKQFVIFIDQAQYVDEGYIELNDGSYLAQDDDFVDGYSVFNFADADNPINIEVWNAYPGAWYVWMAGYLNNEDIDDGYLYSYYGRLNDKDVLKIFLASVPEFHDVTFDVADGLTPSVLCDIIVPVEDFEATLSVLTGTQIDINAAGVSVKENGTALTAKDGVFTLTISADTEIEIGEDQGTAISNAQAVSDNNVYTLQGVLLIKNATQAQINALPAGLYIINGQTSYLLQR